MLEHHTHWPEAKVYDVQASVEKLAKGTETALSLETANIENLDIKFRKLNDDSRVTQDLISKLVRKMKSNIQLGSDNGAGQNRDVSRKNTSAEKLTKGRNSPTLLSTSEKIKNQQKNTAINKENEPGDSNFVAARNTFHRLQECSPLPSDAERKIIFLSFDSTMMPTVSRIFLHNVHVCYKETFDSRFASLFLP